MKLRVARHTAHIQPLIDFYCGLLDLEILGEFHDHDGYDGVFIGNRGQDWHLEFTVSDEAPVHQPDHDDLLVFYAESEAEFHHLTEQFHNRNIPEVEANNPYWREKGKTYTDPDGFRIVISKAHYE
ncbi:VOC family protein [Flavobacterium caeni]|uniref:Glyoxalase/Bleomycin resistance protein/Dioxygenase superfamily protein n=1 Tax=Flavobacterium caeni TaxID=490189 RepID=A0A1G5D8Y6_9FLAO|nr:VOC family protein [Flavobacterium caeni]SCY11203.1 Glyoxalase/Bleomycin resistance protein/Dioxygenase superfamily protein [Flavobacterium caeni]